MCEDIRGAVPRTPGSDRQGDDGRKDQNEIHHHEYRLQLAHPLGHGRCNRAVRDDSCQEHAVDLAVRRGPISISSDHDD